MKSEMVYIGIGSNVGERLENLRQACLALSKLLDGFQTSSVWETVPLIVEDQPPFLNMVVSGKSSLDPFRLLDELNGIEASLGRMRCREIPKGPRTMDLDLLLYSDNIINTETLTVPHPGIKKRAFVLYPLLELYPADQSVSRGYKNALEQLADQGVECHLKLKEEENLLEALEGKSIE